MDARAVTDRVAGGQVESTYAWLRLVASTGLSTVGGVGMWSFVVALPAVQADFGLGRGEASLPFTAVMMGFGLGAMAIGRLVDRFGVFFPLVGAAVALGVGYVAAGHAANVWQLALAHGAIGLGSSAPFGPLVADLSRWFSRRRGIAVAICSSGNSLAGVIWPPLVEHLVATTGWRAMHIGVGIACTAIMLPLALALRRPAPTERSLAERAAAAQAQDALGLSPAALTALLGVAGVACCAAMAMPQVHLVAYCGDLGYGVARGAEMLSLMLGCSLISRIACGFIADRIGGVATLLISATLQASGLLDPQTTTTAVGTSFYESVLHQQDLKTFDVAIPVTSLKSKEAALDKNMYKALKAEACPTIAFHLSNYAVAKDTATAGNFVAKVNGLLTIACQQQPVMFDTVLTPGTDAMHVVGQYTLLMTDYGVKPPTLMMGAIKVKNEVTIHFDLRLDDSAR